jgi:SnoaL-like domain
MAACYHADIRFSDPVFVALKGQQAGDMWRMLTSRGSDLSVEVSNIAAEGQTGSAHWDARYTFSATGRKVLNRIDANFRFADGLIIEHIDRFNLWRWAAQALGPVGLLLGWSPPVQGKIRAQANEALRKFSAERRPA